MYHCVAGDYLGRTGVHERFTGNLRCDMAIVLLRILLSDLEWCTYCFTWKIREETGFLQIEEELYGDIRG